jgi:hypothetical protein
MFASVLCRVERARVVHERGAVSALSFAKVAGILLASCSRELKTNTCDSIEELLDSSF